MQAYSRATVVRRFEYKLWVSPDTQKAKGYLKIWCRFVVHSKTKLKTHNVCSFISHIDQAKLAR